MTLSPDAEDNSLQDLMVFHELGRALTSSLDLHSILSVILKQMEKFFQPTTWSLLMVDEQRRDLYLAIVAGDTTEGQTDTRVPMGEGIAGWVAQHGETLIVPKLKLHPLYRPVYAPGSQAAGAAAGAHGEGSAICIPLQSHGKTFGVIQLLNCDLDTLTDTAIKFLHVLCDYAAVAIENAEAVRLIQELTIVDDCTGVYNVRYLYQRLEEEIQRSRRASVSMSLIFLDLDRFKSINDEHGHLAGSRLLSDVAHKIHSEVRSMDLTFRYGGDEFVVLLPGTARAEAMEVARRLQETIRSLHLQIGPDLRLTIRASLGVSTYPECGVTPEEIIREADKAMYRVKNTTRDGVAAAECSFG